MSTYRNILIDSLNKIIQTTLKGFFAYHLQNQAKLISYNYEDVIIHEGDPPGGIYIIVSGMVRVSVQPSEPPFPTRTIIYKLMFPVTDN